MLASLFPENYVRSTEENPANASSRYFKPNQIKPGESTTLRLCGTPSTGHAICGYTYFTTEGRPRRFKLFPKDYLEDVGLTYEGKTKGTGEKARPAFFLSWACLRKEAEDFQIVDFPQKTIREQIEAVLDMEDYTIEPGEMDNFYLTITRKKPTGTDTFASYTVVPTLKVASKADQQRWADARDGIWLPALFEGGDPFSGQPSAPKSADAIMPITHRDELGADKEVGTGDDW